MAHVVTQACIRCKYSDCVEVCPVDAFREGANMVVIDPEACICCGACVTECPIGAIADEDEPAGAPWAELNARHARLWPIITKRRTAQPDAAQFVDVPDKHRDWFDPSPGPG